MRMHPLALAESGWVWVGADSRPAGVRTGRAIPGLRRDAALPVRQNTRQGREGGALPKPCLRMAPSPARGSWKNGRSRAEVRGLRSGAVPRYTVALLGLTSNSARLNITGTIFLQKGKKLV